MANRPDGTGARSAEVTGVRRIQIYDTTLRDGTQGLGFNLSVGQKLEVLKQLDRMGVDYVEGGYPLSNPKDAAFFAEARDVRLNRTKLAAFGMTRRKGVSAAEDTGMRALVAAETPVVTVVGKTWDFHVREVLRVSLDENLAMIRDSLGFLADAGREVIYDAEHFFDGYRENPTYALETLRAALDGRATTLVLCDTNGGTMPSVLGDIVGEVRRTFPDVAIGIHPHNDSALAVANALEAVLRGASQVQGTINGVGERCGNVDLIPVVANLSLKLGFDVLGGAPDVSRLTELSRFVNHIADRDPERNQAYVGESAFAHKGGMHVHAVQRNVATYEHVPPESVGNERRILVSELSGVSNIQDRIATLMGRRELDRDTLRMILDAVNRLEKEGYVFEEAEASFELLVRRLIGEEHRHFRLDHYQASVFKMEGAHPVSTGLVRARVDGEVVRGTSEGEDPLSALDGALRRALETHFPELDTVDCIDRKFRAIDKPGTRSCPVRVLTTFACGTRHWTTVAIGENVIDAGLQCLVEGFEWHLLHANEMLDGDLAGTPGRAEGSTR